MLVGLYGGKGRHGNGRAGKRALRARSALDRAIARRSCNNLLSDVTTFASGFSHHLARSTPHHAGDGRAPRAARPACILLPSQRARGTFRRRASAMLSLIASWPCAFSITTLHPGRRRCLSARAEAQEGGLARAPQEATAASTRQARMRPPSAVANQPNGTGHTQVLGT